MKRFQECNLAVQLLRRLKYQPWYFLYAAFMYVRTALLNFLHDEYESSDDYISASLAFKLFYSGWHSKANWWYSMEEVMRKYGDEDEV